MQGDYKVCPVCGTPAELNAGVCGRCGHVYRTQFGAGPGSPQAPFGQPSYGQSPYPRAPYGQVYGPDAIVMPPGLHGVGMAVFLSLCCVSGAAQIYNKQIWKGVAFFAAALIAGALTYGLGGLVVSLLACVDGIKIARRLHRGEVVRAWQFF